MTSDREQVSLESDYYNKEFNQHKKNNYNEAIFLKNEIKKKTKQKRTKKKFYRRRYNRIKRKLKITATVNMATYETPLGLAKSTNELVYRNCSLGMIEEGLLFIVSCTKRNNFESFSIILKDLIRKKPNIPLKIDVRILENYISRRSKVAGRWSEPEFSSANYIKSILTFKLEILVTIQEYLLFLDGNHFGGFRHRLPLNVIKCIEVRGDVGSVTVARSRVTTYPQKHKIPKITNLMFSSNELNECIQLSFTSSVNSLIALTNLPLPYYCKLPKTFSIGHKIVIEGRIKILPQYFFINLQNGTRVWPNSIVLFHFNVRFLVTPRRKPIIYKNACLNGQWGISEWSKIPKKLAPGRSFILILCVSEKSYEVYLDEELITKFEYRNTSMQVDTVHIRGDIFLHSVGLIFETLK